MGHWLQSNFVLSHRKSIRSRICWLHWFLCVAQRSQFWAARLVNMISSGRVIHRTFGVSTYDACANRCITIQCRPTHVGHQPICNKSHFTVWLEVSLLDVYSISDGFQLCCQASKISLMDYQKPIIKCSPMDIQPLNLWHAFCCITELARLSFIQCVCTCAERALILGKFLHAF